MDPLQTETADFWRNAGEYNDVDTAAIQTTVFRLPTTCFAEENGGLVNSGRGLQWHWKPGEPPARAGPAVAIMAGRFHRLRGGYLPGGGGFPDPIVGRHVAYA